MKDSYLINFSLFCLKRKFNLLTYLTANENVTYEQFSDLMRSKSVTPPDLRHFNKVKSKATSINLAKKAEQSLLENSKKNFDKETTVKEEKPKRKRRYKKKSEKRNDSN
tara:strand:+ start:266 stop:592 length:327 start_codon:yes stop_codon:yes gene_type:complete